MIKQSQIKRRLEHPDSITLVRGILGRIEHFSRAALADAVCQDFGFLDSRGATQRAGCAKACAKALREMEQARHFVLPVGHARDAARPRKRRTPRGLGTPVAAPLDVPEQAGCVRALQLLKVDTAQGLRLWNELMCEHPQGAGVMVGALLRYLIGSEHGWLGGLGFGASAIKLGDRDRWIGWNTDQQREHLHRVIGTA